MPRSTRRKNKKIIFITDIHCNFVHPEKLVHFYNEINKQKGDFVVLTGDIAEAPSVRDHILFLQSMVNIPVYFVLGNHDYYHGRIQDVRNIIAENFGANQTHNSSIWLPSVPFISIDEERAIVGHDGWYDGEYANFWRSSLQMSDFRLIEDFRYLFENERYDLAKKLAYDASVYVRNGIHSAIKNGHKKIIVATHVPPFKENSVYNGKVSDHNWLPYFSSKYMGDAIVNVMGQYPNVECLVLCGHSHGESVYKPLPNVTSILGKARYSYPKISAIYKF